MHLGDRSMYVCEQLVQFRYRQLTGRWKIWQWNPRPHDRKSDAVTITPLISDNKCHTKHQTMQTVTGIKSWSSRNVHSRWYSVIGAPLLTGSCQLTTATVGDLKWMSGGAGVSGTPAPVNVCSTSEYGPHCNRSPYDWLDNNNSIHHGKIMAWNMSIYCL